MVSNMNNTFNFVVVWHHKDRNGVVVDSTAYPFVGTALGLVNLINENSGKKNSMRRLAPHDGDYSVTHQVIILPEPQKPEPTWPAGPR